jgi:hypothetical protein
MGAVISNAFLNTNALAGHGPKESRRPAGASSLGAGDLNVAWT